QLAGRGVGRDVQHLGHDDVVQIPAHGLHLLHQQAGHGKAPGQLLHGPRDVDVLFQPVVGYSHRVNTSKLTQEAEIVVEKQPNVVDAVAEHRDALDAHAEREARPPLRIVADVEQHLRMDHAGAQNLQPAFVAADAAAGAVAHDALDVHLGAGLRK